MKSKKGTAAQMKGSMNWIVLAVIMVVVAGAVIFAVTQQKGRAASYPAEINITQAAEKRAQGAFILDVRQPEEWQAVHIPGATLIPLGELASRVDELPRDREIVVVCRSGNRSQQGRDILKQAGFHQVTSMAGGVTQWQAQGLPTASGQ